MPLDVCGMFAQKQMRMVRIVYDAPIILNPSRGGVSGGCLAPG